MTTGWFQSSIPKTELINPKKIAKVITRNATIIRFRYGDEGLVGFSLNSTDKYYTKDLFGNISGIYGADGTKYVSYEYDAWGNHTVTLDLYGIGTVNPFRYIEYYYDTETGLYYLQSRYYDPETGRFINADVQFDSGITGKNLFVYCNNNPVSSINPEGKKAMQTVIDLISQYSDAIISAGKEYCVDPVVIAGCIFVEQLNNVNFLDTFDVAAGVLYNIDT